MPLILGGSGASIRTSQWFIKKMVFITGKDHSISPLRTVYLHESPPNSRIIRSSKGVIAVQHPRMKLCAGVSDALRIIENVNVMHTDVEVDHRVLFPKLCEKVPEDWHEVIASPRTTWPILPSIWMVCMRPSVIVVHNQGLSDPTGVLDDAKCLLMPVLRGRSVLSSLAYPYVAWFSPHKTKGSILSTQAFGQDRGDGDLDGINGIDGAAVLLSREVFEGENLVVHMWVVAIAVSEVSQPQFVFFRLLIVPDGHSGLVLVRHGQLRRRFSVSTASESGFGLRQGYRLTCRVVCVREGGEAGELEVSGTGVVSSRLAK